LCKNYIFVVIIIGSDNESRFFIKYINYFILNLIDNPGFEDIDINIFDRIILLKTKYFSID
jgi:hypothetical protein